MSNKNYPNLKPWKSGQSGNPAGRKVGSKNVSTIVRQLLEQDADTCLLTSSSITDLTNGKPTTYAQAMTLAMLKKALEGDVRAVKWLAEQQERNYATRDVANGIFYASKLIFEVVPSDKSTVG